MTDQINVGSNYFSLLKEPHVEFYQNKAFFTQLSEKGFMTTYFKDIMEINPKDFLNKNIPVDAAIMHPDRVDYQGIINAVSEKCLELTTEAVEIENKIHFYREQMERIQEIFQNDMANVLFKDLGFDSQYLAMLFHIPLKQWVMGALLPEQNSKGLALTYNGIEPNGNSYNIKLTSLSLDSEFPKSIYNQLFVNNRSRYRPSMKHYLSSYNLKYFSDNWDLFQEGVRFYTSKELKYDRLKSEEVQNFLLSGTSYDFFAEGILKTRYSAVLNRLLQKNGIQEIINNSSPWSNHVVNGVVNLEMYAKHWEFAHNQTWLHFRWPYYSELFALHYNSTIKVITDILTYALESYGMKIKNESVKLQYILHAIDRYTNTGAFYGAISKFRDSFNKSIEELEWIDFPNLDVLEDLSNIHEVPMSIAYEMYCSKNSYQGLNFVYPRFVVDYAIYLCLIKEEKNFLDLTDTQKENFLNLSIFTLEAEVFFSKDLSDRIKFRKNLDSKFVKTLRSIDANYAKIKLEKLVRGILESNPEYKAQVDKYLSNDGFGFIKVKLPKIKISAPKITISAPKIDLPKISLPKIVIPAIKIPEINIVNIVMPKSINPIDGILSLIGADDDTKALYTKIANKVTRSPIYIPIVSEAVQSAEDITNTVVKAGGQIVQETGKFIANSPQLVADVIKLTGQAAHDLFVSPAEQIVDGVAYAVLPKDIAQKIDLITNVPSKAVTGKLTEKDLREAGQAALKLSIAPVAFAGKISADIVDNAIKNIPLVAELDQYSGGMLSSSSRIARSTHDEYESKAHDPRVVLDIIKIGLTIATAGSVSAAIDNVASNTIYNALSDKTGVGGTELRAIVNAYNSGDIVGASADYAKSTAIKETAKEVENKTGVPALALTSVATGVDSGKSVPESVYDVAKDSVKKEIQNEIKKKIGIPVSIDDIMEFNVSKFVQFDSPDEIVEVLKESVNKEIEKRYNEILNLASNIENYSSEDLWVDTKKMLEKEKEKAINKLYADFYDLKEKYWPEGLLNYLMLMYGPRPDYSEFMDEVPQDINWETWQPPEPIYVYEKPKKPVAGMVVAGVGVGLLAIMSMRE
jgi:hypothetical protein